eukprot:7028786-Prorocentrum_lima.AAC.1
MASRQGEQQALMHCEQMGQLRLSEYQHNLLTCRQRGNQGSQYCQMEVSALQNMNTFSDTRAECTTWHGE